jgi:hypothetical protein
LGSWPEANPNTLCEVITACVWHSPSRSRDDLMCAGTALAACGLLRFFPHRSLREKRRHPSRQRIRDISPPTVGYCLRYRGPGRLNASEGILETSPSVVEPQCSRPNPNQRHPPGLSLWGRSGWRFHSVRNRPRVAVLLRCSLRMKFLVLDGHFNLGEFELPPSPPNRRGDGQETVSLLRRRLHMAVRGGIWWHLGGIRWPSGSRPRSAALCRQRTKGPRSLRSKPSAAALLGGEAC